VANGAAYPQIGPANVHQGGVACGAHHDPRDWWPPWGPVAERVQQRRVASMSETSAADADHRRRRNSIKYLLYHGISP